jgi:hypothetical protein
MEGLFYLAATGRLSELNQVGTSPVPGLTGDLLDLADRRMYRAKRRKKG